MNRELAAKEKIELLYKMIFPLKSEFNGDYSSACFILRREIRKMCSPEFRLPLLMIASVLDIKPKFTDKTKLENMCQLIRIELENYCLSLEGPESTQMLIAMKTEIPPHTSSSIICSEFVRKFVERFNETYVGAYNNLNNYLVRVLYSMIIGVNIEISNNINAAIREMIRRKIISNLFQPSVIFANLYDQLSKTNIDFSKIGKEMISDDLSKPYKFSIQEKEFLQYLHYLYINQMIPFDIKIKDLCTNSEVLKFRSSVDK